MNSEWNFDKLPSVHGGEDFDLPEREKFPVDCFPAAAKEMAEEITRVTTSQNLILAATSILGTAAAALGGGIEMSTGGERVTKGNLFLLVIAESGSGKGEAFRLAAAPFFEAEKTAVLHFEKEVRPTLVAELELMESRAKKIASKSSGCEDPAAKKALDEEYLELSRKMEQTRGRLNSVPKFAVSDSTKEALAVAMANQPNEAVSSMSSEARGVLSVIKGRYSKAGGDEDIYCSGYSGDHIMFDRIGRERVSLCKPCLNALWMVQPDSAREAIGDESLLESGLVPRFLMVDAGAEPQLRPALPDPIPVSVKVEWHKIVGALVGKYRNNGAGPLRVTVDKEAMEAFHGYEQENVSRRRSDGDLRDIPSLVARWGENAWRIGLVLHALKHGVLAHEIELEAETASAAIRISKWFSKEQLSVFSQFRHQRGRKRLSALLTVLANAPEGMSMRDLGRSHSFTAEEVEALSRQFPDHVEIVTHHPKIGRPSTKVFTKRAEDRSKK